MISKKLINAMLVSSLFLAATVASASAEDGVLRIGTEGDAPNFSMADPSGNVTGFDADIANGICAELKIKCKFVVQTFSSLVPSMDNDRFDVIISGLGITAERQKKIDYSIPYATTPLYFVVAKDSPLANLKSLDEIKASLTGKTIGVVTGTTYLKFIQKIAPDADVKTYDGTTQQESDLAAGRLEVAFGDQPTWADFFNTPESANFTRIDVRVTAVDAPDVLGHGMGVGMRKGNSELKAKVDAALCNMINGGKVKEASMHWFHDDYTIPCSK